jgi:hypothetical protein
MAEPILPPAPITVIVCFVCMIIVFFIKQSYTGT